MATPDPSESAAEFGSHLSQYVSHDRMEILDILRAVMQSGALVSLYFGRGGDFVLTSILDLDERRMILDYGPDESINRRALASGHVRAVTQHDRVRVEFSTDVIEKASYHDRPGFSLPVPDQLLRLQRRQDYRLAVPVTQPPHCWIELPEIGNVELKVVDISCGGVALAGFPKSFKAAPEMTFPNCRIELPSIGTVDLNLEVRNVIEIVQKAGTRGLRAGCMFVDAPDSTASLIQRYIMKIERDRRARVG